MTTKTQNQNTPDKAAEAGAASAQSGHARQPQSDLKKLVLKGKARAF